MTTIQQPKFSQCGEGFISSLEAERLVNDLRPFEVADVGQSRWIRQKHDFEALNAQAHHNARLQRDEYVMEAMVTFDKVKVLVQNLICIDVWKQYVLPLVFEDFAQLNAQQTLKPYMIIYSEAVFSNFIEVLLFHKRACESAGETLLDLGDYCDRRITYLISDHLNRHDSRIESDKGPIGTFLAQQKEVEFACCMICVSLVRFLFDHAESLPPSVTTRLLDVHDILMSMVSLVEKAPWKRRNKSGSWEKFNGTAWEVVANEDLQRFCKPEAQVWLTIAQCICGREVRRKYHIDGHRIERLSRLIPFLNEALEDQLPLLTEVKHQLHQLTITQGSAPPQSSALLIEQLPELRPYLTRNRNWPELASQIVSAIRNESPDDRRRDIEAMARLYSNTSLDDVLEAPKCAQCGQVATQRCSKCKAEWYCSRPCQVVAWGRHRAVCAVMGAALQKSGDS